MSIYLSAFAVFFLQSILNSSENTQEASKEENSEKKKSIHS